MGKNIGESLKDEREKEGQKEDERGRRAIVDACLQLLECVNDDIALHLVVVRREVTVGTNK